MPHNYEISPKEDLQIANNARVISRTLDSHIYFPKVDHSHFWDDVTLTGSTKASDGGRSYTSLPNGSDVRLRANLRRELEWKSGILKMRAIWYTTSVTGNNVYGDQFALSAFNTSSTTAIYTTGNVAITLPGATTIGLLTKLDLTSRNDLFIKMDTQIDNIIISINRDGGHASDTNTGEWQFQWMDLEYVETDHIIGENYNKPVVY